MEWTRGPTIGRGSSAAVSLATTSTGQIFAVKSAELSRSSSLQNEHHLISQLCSPFIVKSFGSEITRENDKSFYNILLEYVPGGTISDEIRNHGGSLDESTVQFYANQVLQGLNYLHERGFVHCDIKGQNILIAEDGLKIADFGCGKCVGSATAAFGGTPAYMAPEAARGEEQSFPADIWALGCTIIEMATGSNPWPEMKDPASALYRIAYSGDVPEIPTCFSENAKDFVRKCLIRDVRERWTAAELLQHRFLDSVETKMAECTKKSPTSVMDQHIWDALEVSPDPTENASYSDSPAGRIRDLIGDDCFGDWTEEEDWVTVRGNETEELIDEDCATDSVIDEQTSIFIEDSLFNYFSDEVRIGGEFIVGESEIEDSLSRIVTFESIVMKNSYDNISTFPNIFYVFFSDIFLCGSFGYKKMAISSFY